MVTASEIKKEFEGIFRQYYKSLCSYAFTILKDAVNSEDVVQDVFIKVWENQKFQIGEDQIRYYLFTAVRNNCLNWLKKNNKHLIQELKEEDAIEEIKITAGNEEKKEDPGSLISHALKQLPPKCREVFVLSRISGLTYQQIADSLGISKKTVENQMGKAIGVLRVFVRENGVSLIIVLYII